MIYMITAPITASDLMRRLADEALHYWATITSAAGALLVRLDDLTPCVDALAIYSLLAKYGEVEWAR